MEETQFSKILSKNFDIEQTIIWYIQDLIHCLNVRFNCVKGQKYKELLINLI